MSQTKFDTVKDFPNVRDKLSTGEDNVAYAEAIVSRAKKTELAYPLSTQSIFICSFLASYRPSKVLPNRKSVHPLWDTLGSPGASVSALSGLDTKLLFTIRGVSFRN